MASDLVTWLHRSAVWRGPCYASWHIAHTAPLHTFVQIGSLTCLPSKAYSLVHSVISTTGGLGSSPGAGGTTVTLWRSETIPGASWHRLLPCTSQKIVHRTVGVVDKQHPPAVLFATVKGAYDMSVTISSLHLLCNHSLCLPAQSRAHAFISHSRGGFGLWACLPDPKRALGAHGVPRIGEVRLRPTALTLEPCGARAGYTPPSADVRVLAWGMGHGAWHMQGTENGSRSFTGSVLESVACEPQPRPTGARDA